jgi:hypothetical protein
MRDEKGTGSASSLKNPLDHLHSYKPIAERPSLAAKGTSILKSASSFISELFKTNINNADLLKKEGLFQ